MKQKSWFRRNIKDIAIDFSIILFAGGIILAAGVLFWVSTLEIPDLSAFEERRVLQSTKIYDRTGQIVFYDIHGEEKRTVIPLGDMPENIKKATIAIEDKDFYRHSGFSVSGMTRALYKIVFNFYYEIQTIAT